MKYPRSAYDKVGGLVYFARMLDKIRLQAEGELSPEYFEFMPKGFNLRLLQYLRIHYAALVERTLQGGTDEEILEWCYQQGHRLEEIDIYVWNGFATHRGINDDGTVILAQFKKASGFENRDDIQTFFHYYDVDEKRQP